ncbi:MAG: hypothetical protein QM493_07855 [Sulfurovum sp.]
MPIIFLVVSIFILSGCMDTIEVPSIEEERSSQKIIVNKIDAQKAKEEYKKIQAQR